MNKISEFYIDGSKDIEFLQKEVQICIFQQNVFVRYDIYPFQGQYCIAKYSKGEWEVVYQYEHQPKSKYIFSSSMQKNESCICVAEYEKVAISHACWGKIEAIQQLTTKFLDCDGQVQTEEKVIFATPLQHLGAIGRKNIVYAQDNSVVCNSITGVEQWRKSIKGQISDLIVNEEIIAVFSSDPQENMYVFGGETRQCTLFDSNGNNLLDDQDFTIYTNSSSNSPKFYMRDGRLYLLFVTAQQGKDVEEYKVKRWMTYQCIEQGKVIEESKVLIHLWPINILFEKEKVFISADFETKTEVYFWRPKDEDIQEFCVIKQKPNMWDYMQIESLNGCILLWQTMKNTRLFLHHKNGKQVKAIEVEGWAMVNCCSDGNMLVVLYEEGKAMGKRTKFLVEVYHL